MTKSFLAPRLTIDMLPVSHWMRIPHFVWSIANVILSFSSVLLILIILSSGLFGQSNSKEEKWIQKGRIFYEFGLGLESVKNPTTQSNDYAVNYYRSLSSEDNRSFLIGAAGISDSQKQTDLTGNNQKLSLEYTVNSWLGIGGSLQNSMITSYSLTKNDTELSNTNYKNLQAASLFITELREISDFFNVYGLLPDKKQMQALRTYDYDVTLHIPYEGNLDPYFRVSVGRGFLTEDLIGRIGWSSGFKWKVDSTFYFNTDLYQSRMISKSKSGDIDNFLETGIRFGAGLYSTWPN